jgi:agmatinase
MLVRLGNRPVYISVDIDVLDPSHAPAPALPRREG